MAANKSLLDRGFDQGPSRVPFNPALKTNVVFVVGQPQAIPSKDVEAYLWKRIEDLVKTLPADENIVVLGHENIDPFGGELSARYGRHWNRNSIIARGVNRLGKEKRHMMLALGPFLFVSNGQHHVLNKNKDPFPEEQDDAAFRLCAAIHQYPLSPNVTHYFVPAAALGYPDEAPVIPDLDDQTMYINDAINGVRIIIGSVDTGWIKGNIQESVSHWDGQNYDHFVLDLRPPKR